MRRVLLVLTVAAVMLAVAASAVLAAAPAPSADGPGNPQTPANTVDPTKSAGQNCYGQLSSNNNKGPGGNPGSLADPTTFDPDAEGPLPEQLDYTGHAVSSLKPGAISGFQKEFRDQAAGKSC
jgi:hypothetical protein